MTHPRTARPNPAAPFRDAAPAPKPDFAWLASRLGNARACNDAYSGGHCDRVATIACAIAVADGFASDALHWLRIGALLHDVGKAALPRAILDKPAALDAAEWELVRRHPLVGAEMVMDLAFPADVRPGVQWHHERWDGTGYPHRLPGEEIPRAARIVCIADVYDALTSERSYKHAISHDLAMAAMRADAGRQFDPTLFALFERVAEAHAGEWAQQPALV